MCAMIITMVCNGFYFIYSATVLRPNFWECHLQGKRRLSCTSPSSAPAIFSLHYNFVVKRWPH